MHANEFHNNWFTWNLKPTSAYLWGAVTGPSFLKVLSYCDEWGDKELTLKPKTHSPYLRTNLKAFRSESRAPRGHIRATLKLRRSKQTTFCLLSVVYLCIHLCLFMSSYSTGLEVLDPVLALKSPCTLYINSSAWLHLSPNGAFCSYLLPGAQGEFLIWYFLHTPEIEGAQWLT